MADARFPDDPKPWAVLARRTLLTRKFFTLREDHVRLPGGAEIPDYCVSEHRPWVNVVAVTPHDEIVLVRQYRHGLGAVHDELPGGVLDASDPSPEAGARRELREETGYGGGTWRPLLTISPNPANQDNWMHCFLAEGVTREGEPAPEATEELRVRTVPVSELLALVDSGGIAQALCVAPIARYLLERSRRR